MEYPTVYYPVEISGERDESVPPSQHQLLYDTANHTKLKQLCLVSNGAILQYN